MQTKTKTALVVAGGAGLAYIFLSKSPTADDSPFGAVSGTGAGLTPGEIITNPIETITETIPALIMPIIRPSEPYIGSKKFYTDVDKGIFGDTEFYNVSTVDSSEQIRRRAEIAASKMQGTAIVAPWDVAGAGSIGGSKKSSSRGGSSRGGGSSWGSWGGGSSFNITPSDVPSGTSEYNDPLSGGGGGKGGGSTWTDPKRRKKTTTKKKKSGGNPRSKGGTYPPGW